MQTPPLRGRDDSLAAVRDLLRHGGALTFVGSAGIGRTAMLDAASEQATADGMTVLRADGAPAETDVPYAGLHALLRGSPGAASVLKRIEAGDAGLAVPAEVLRVLGEAAPVLCRVDDAHLMDRPTLDVLGFVARRCALDRAGPGIALLAASETPVGLGAERVLAPLDDADARDLLSTTLPGEVRDAVVAAACGHPLAIVEMAAALTPEQRAGTVPPSACPPRGGRLWRALAARVDGLPAATREVLLLPAAEPGLGVDALARATGTGPLAPAEAAGIVVVEDGRVRFRHPLHAPVVYALAPLDARRAAHRLLARVLRRDDDVLRRALHRAAALDAPDAELADDLERAALAARPFARPAELADVLERAGELTADHRVRAGRLAAAAGAAWTAGRTRRAERLLARSRALLPEGDTRAGLVHGNLELRGGFTVAAADELLSAATDLADRDRARAVRAHLRAAEAAYLGGDHRRYLAVAREAGALRRPDDPPSLRLMFDYLDGVAATFRGRHREAAGPLRRVLALTGRSSSPSALVWASVASLLLGEDARAVRLGERALDIARGQGAVAVVPQVMEFIVHARTWMGDHASAEAVAVEGLRLAEETGQPNTAVQHLSSLAMFAAIQGDADAVRARSRAASRLAAAHRVALVEARGALALAQLDLAAGRHARAVSRLRAAAWTAAGQGHLVVQVMATPQFVEAATRTGDEAEARAAVAVFERWAGSTGSPDRLALAARCRALLAAPAAKPELYRYALDLHQRGQADFERARTQLLYGGALRRQRRRGDAREHLHDALETFERLGARPWAEHARAELRASGEPVRSRDAAAAADLSPQQAQIARMAASGATNREIAARLYLSPRTVEHHLGKIFTRLGVRSRVELARLF
ncbi:helix-turn-helix transcriptional regulator [Actinomadura gamaensis]|uniref:LuxR C-terminal-related transcriptional regulator n=1 Tax=Actinomadura gamaensis TaxID=1763541 RepID=A0ABV9U5L1_9ACTN